MRGLQALLGALDPTLIHPLAQWAAGWAGPPHCSARRALQAIGTAGLEECASCYGDLTFGTAGATEPMAMCMACVLPQTAASVSLSMERLLLLRRGEISVGAVAPTCFRRGPQKAFCGKRSLRLVQAPCACTCVSVCAALPVEIRVLEEIAWLSPKWMSSVVGPGWDPQGSGW